MGEAKPRSSLPSIPKDGLAATIERTLLRNDTVHWRRRLQTVATQHPKTTSAA